MSTQTPPRKYRINTRTRAARPGEELVTEPTPVVENWIASIDTSTNRTDLTETYVARQVAQLFAIVDNAIPALIDSLTDLDTDLKTVNSFDRFSQVLFETEQSYRVSSLWMELPETALDEVEGYIKLHAAIALNKSILIRAEANAYIIEQLEEALSTPSQLSFGDAR